MIEKKIEIRTCLYCNTDISKKSPIAKICGSSNCKKAYSRDYYNNTTNIKNCAVCGISFIGRYHKIYCNDCLNDRLKNKKYQTIVKEIKCKYCGVTIKSIEKCLTKKETELFIETCDECTKNIRLKQSNYMKTHNPAFTEGQTEKRVRVVMTKEEFSNLMSEKMKTNNPMFNKETRKKVSKTLNEKIHKGEIIYKKGTESPLWKGNRNFNKHCRINLRKWSRQCMESVDFTCQKCFTRGTELHTHHSTPLRDIIKSFLLLYKKNATSVFEDEDILNRITEEIVQYHYNNKVGIVLCKKCHAKNDNFYHKLKGDS